MEANSRQEAKEIAEAKWRNSEYSLDDDRFTGTRFEVLYGERVKETGMAR